MKALVLLSDKTLEYKDVPEPDKLTDDSSLVKIVSSGICGSDIHRGFEGGAYHYPLIMGHEFAGIIEDPSSGSNYKKGDRVTVFPLLWCGKCEPCRSGHFAQCTDYNYFGSRSDGGFAEYLYIPEANLIPVPEHVDIMHAAMTEPCAVALHGVRKFKINKGDTGAVFGSGPIGNIAAQWLKISGCEKVIVVDIDDDKLSIADKMGFITVNSKKNDPVEFIIKQSEGRGALRVVEACGLPITFLQAVQSAGQFGEVVFMGNINGQFRIDEKDFSGILRKELKIMGTWNSGIVPKGDDDWSTVLKYMDKELDVSPLISHTPDLKDGAEMFQKIISREEYINKVVFKI